MLTNVFAKTTRDRLMAGLIGAVSCGILLVLTIWIYQDVDVSFYYDFPQAILDMVGIGPAGSGLAGIAYGSVYNLIGAFVVGGIAISIGASSIAGEETEGTLGFLLGNPVSRRGVLLSKAASMTLIVAVMGVLLWLAGLIGAAIFDIDLAGLMVGSLVFALSLNGLFYGLLAMAIGASTGSRGGASGAATALMVVGYVAANLLPIAGLTGVARVFPWYYFSGSAPLNNGLDPADVSVLLVLCLVCLAVAWIGVQRRDLREKGTAVTLLDRLREHPLTRKVTERLAGSARVSRISVKTATDFQGVLTITASIMFYLGLVEAPVFNLLPDEFIQVFSSFPDALIAMVGGVDYSTPTGFLTGEVYSIVGPIAVIVLMALMGARAFGGEEEAHTMGLLMSNPIKRSHVVVEKAIAMALYAFIFGAAAFAGTWIGTRIAGLDEVTVGGIASISTLLALFGLSYGGIALAVSAATGRTRAATMATTGFTLVTWFIFSFFPLSESFDRWVNLSPFHWYLGNDPLLNGMDWGSAALFGAAFLALVAVSVVLFERRDLRG
jgi:beta-exotoxin I transport system permease protein